MPSSVFQRFRLDGKTAMVVGVGPGIGAQVANAFTEAGAKVVLCARTPDVIESLAENIRMRGGSALTVQADAGRKDDLDRLVHVAQEGFGDVDILFYAAYASRDPSLSGDGILELADEAWERCFAVNMLAPYRLARSLVPGMQRRGAGSIINVLTTAAFTPIEGKGLAAYGSTKAALLMMTRYLAKECAPLVRVNAICPGTIAPKPGVVYDIWKPLLPGIPLGRVGAADEVAGAALFLASDASSYTTGQTLFVDGGRVSGAA